jgi:hypothetical protein
MMMHAPLVTAAEIAAPWERAALKETVYAPQKAVFDVARTRASSIQP